MNRSRSMVIIRRDDHDGDVPRSLVSLLPDARRKLIAERLRRHGSVSVSAVEAEFRISSMTARRDLDELERRGVARRTHGGAVLPGLASHEDSFLQRLEVAVEAKERLAETVLGMIEPGEAVFVDSSTTGYYAARRIVRENLKCTLLTNAVPIMELVCEIDAAQVNLVGAGGTLRKLTRSFVGPQAVHCIEAHFADHVLFSVRGLTPDGFLTDPDPLESEVKRAMLQRARQAVLLVDGSKFDRPALTQIAKLDDVGVVLAADVSEASLKPLVRAGVDVRRV
jgi:DeoR/GlpR family transcriptional regulator of sugar metabolism